MELCSGRPPGDADRSRRHRQDEPRDRGCSPRSNRGSGTVRGSSTWLRWTTPIRSGRRSPTGSASSTAPNGRPHRPAVVRRRPLDDPGPRQHGAPPGGGRRGRRDRARLAGSRIIVTSRAPLRIAGEHEFSVAPLVDERPGPVHRSGPRRPAGWEAGRRADVVAEICDLLDDLPLGIELAAARVAASAADRHPRPPGGASAIARAADLETHPRASGRSKARSPGVTTSSLPIARRCFIGSASSRAASTSSRWTRSSARRRRRRSSRRPARARGPEPHRRGTDPRRQGEVPHAADDPVLRPRPAGAATASRPTFAGATPRPISPSRPR